MLLRAMSIDSGKTTSITASPEKQAGPTKVYSNPTITTITIGEMNRYVIRPRPSTKAWLSMLISVIIFP